MILNDFLDRNVRCYPLKEALVFRDHRYTYGEVGERVNRFTHFMLDLGIAKGDRVALLAKNSHEYMIVYFGNFQIGAVVCPVNFRLTAGEVEYIVNQSDAKCLIFDQEYVDLVEKIKPRLKNVEHYIMWGDGGRPEGILSYEELMKRSSAENYHGEIQEEDIAVQMYTSGTTGYPKGAMLSHKNLKNEALFTALITRINNGGRTLVSAPLFHAAGMVSTYGAIVVGGTLVIMDKFDPEAVLKAFSEEKITHGFFAPAMLRMLLSVPEIEKYDFSSIENIAFGSAPMTHDLLVESMRVFQCDFLQGFGQTEATCNVTTMFPEEYRCIAGDPERMGHLMNSVGKEFPGVHVRVVDENDNDVPVGEVGEIIVQGANIMLGYYKMPEETEKTLRGGWLYTGDLGKYDEDRYLYIVDRKKDMIISGGENIYSSEIEGIIRSLQGVTEVAVVGMPHKKWGEVPKAFVVQAPNANLTVDEVIQFCKEHLASFKCPKEVDFIAELPRNAAGKILKRALRGLH